MEPMDTVEELRSRQTKLVEALESGTYAQGDSQLRDGDMFCCLGVACDLFMKETGKGAWTIEDSHFAVDNYQEVAWLPKPVAEWFGFGSVTGSFGDTSLMFMNDTKVSFSDIAKVIKEEMDNPDTKLFGELRKGYLE